MKSWLSKLIGFKDPTPKQVDNEKTVRFREFLKTFEEDMECKNIFGAFDEQAYEQFKLKAKTALPESFEAYLRAYNGGIPNGVSHEFGMLFSMQTNEMEASLLSTLHWPQPPGKENLLPIGRDGAMGLFLISLNGADFGVIYSCFAWSDEAEGSLTYEDNLHKVADCFSQMFRVKREYE
ncbi:SMI1/KNR4 family protein [Prosthecobacter sp.]|uniref:SMI1/KNR4 family protein n=1 Tax=Prosthecobacter sp. TaxID=1965333 RepID=UPI0037848CB8